MNLHAERDSGGPHLLLPPRREPSSWATLLRRRRDIMTSSAEFRTGLNNFWGSDPTLEGPKLCERGEGEGSRGGGRGSVPKSCRRVTLPLIGRGKVLTSTAQLLSLCGRLKRNQPQNLSHTISLRGFRERVGGANEQSRQITATHRVARRGRGKLDQAEPTREELFHVRKKP